MLNYSSWSHQLLLCPSQLLNNIEECQKERKTQGREGIEEICFGTGSLSPLSRRSTLPPGRDNWSPSTSTHVTQNKLAWSNRWHKRPKPELAQVELCQFTQAKDINSASVVCRYKPSCCQAAATQSPPVHLPCFLMSADFSQGLHTQSHLLSEVFPNRCCAKVYVYFKTVAYFLFYIEPTNQRNTNTANTAGMNSPLQTAEAEVL